MRSFFPRVILACSAAIFASPTFPFSHFRHHSTFGSLVVSLNRGYRRGITIALLVVRNDGRSAQFP
jgi:hypothetical protein